MNRKTVKGKALPKGWRETRLGEVCYIDKETLSSKTSDNYYFEYIALSDVERGKLVQTQKYKFSESPSRARRKIKQGDVLLATVRPNLQGFYIFKNKVKDCIVSTGFAVLTPKPHLLNSAYLFQMLFSNQMLATYHAANAGSNYPAINSSDIPKFKIFIPPIPEQKAIASLLETWDTAIEKTEALIAANEKRFKWLVEFLISKQQYINRWDEFTLGDLFDIHTYSSKSKSIDETGNRLIVDMGSISRNGDLIATKRTHVCKDFLSVSDLVMPKDDIGGGNIIGKVAIIETAQKYVCGDHVYRLVQKKDISASFLRFLINCSAINKRFKAYANGTSQLGLSKRDVIKQKVRLPPLVEQQHIAHTLNIAQKEITLLKQLTKSCRTQKRELIRKLLVGKWHVNQKDIQK